jgi:hypothetical protein
MASKTNLELLQLVQWEDMVVTVKWQAWVEWVQWVRWHQHLHLEVSPTVWLLKVAISSVLLQQGLEQVESVVALNLALRPLQTLDYSNSEKSLKWVESGEEQLLQLDHLLVYLVQL